MSDIRLDDIIKDARSIAISGHVRPDGDCVGSCLGVYNYITAYYPEKEVSVILESIPDVFHFLSGSDKVETASDEKKIYDLFIALDCGEIGRLGDSGHYFTDAKHTLCVDHHISNKDFADINYVFPKASSTCELIGELIDNDKITKEIAECLYTGIVTDTGLFQFQSTHRSTMNFAGFLMDKGIDYPWIADTVFFAKSLTRGKITAVAWDHARLFADGKIIGSYVSREDMNKLDALPKHMEGISNDLRSTRGVELSIFVYPLPDGAFKGSARSVKTFDCAAFASKYNGGGHIRAAGFSLTGDDPESLVEMLCNEAATQMKD
ncbi:MAG: bifunctional oligoribonuclease/PAP phosphatase NrnA [Lachnospiraceae bacterium]|nr:bifunctional oligoribonuclease/PAP phosphatase NrnA [Lachnospiraceae bacterium]